MPPTGLPGPIAVVDVETTGLFPFRHDRVVEVAAVLINRDGQVEREFVSLVNPGRDIGPTRIHGLTSEDVLHAPSFHELAGHLTESLQGAVAIAGHNVRFDRTFLEAEFTRMDQPFPECHSLCSMQLAGGGKLSDCCVELGLPYDGERHHALADARATAQLLLHLLDERSDVVGDLEQRPCIPWPGMPRSDKRPVTRDQSRCRQAEAPGYLQRLLSSVRGRRQSPADDGATLAYRAILDRVLEDRQVDECEADALVETATRWGLSEDQVRLAHRGYLEQLAIAALTDGVVTETERRDLKLVARLLGLEAARLDEALDEAAGKVRAVSSGVAAASGATESLAGKKVCFTGELLGQYRGEPISREVAEELALKAGLVPVGSVTKKLDLLVLADPHSQSGKAKKAREYGVRIMHEPVFWKAIGADVE